MTARVCEHGNLARVCLTCEQIEEIATLREQLAKVFRAESDRDRLAERSELLHNELAESIRERHRLFAVVEAVKAEAAGFRGVLKAHWSSDYVADRLARALAGGEIRERLNPCRFGCRYCVGPTDSGHGFDVCFERRKGERRRELIAFTPEWNASMGMGRRYFDRRRGKP